MKHQFSQPPKKVKFFILRLGKLPLEGSKHNLIFTENERLETGQTPRKVCQNLAALGNR